MLSMYVNMHSETWHTDTPNFLLAQKSCQGRCYRSAVPLPVGGLDTNHRHEGGVTPLTSIGPLGSVASRNTARRLTFAFVSPSAHMAVVGYRASAGGTVDLPKWLGRPG